MKQLFSILSLARSHRVNVRRCSHGAVSPCWMEQRHESASTQRGGYNICETPPWLVIAGLCIAFLSIGSSTNAQVNVTQEHNHLSRDGLYIDSAFTPANAANVTRDPGFDGTIAGDVYAQLLYVEGGPNGPMVIAVTESNNVYALDANDGSIIWQRNLGPAVTTGLPCGNIDPLGISGTPAVDLASDRKPSPRSDQ